MMKINFKSQSFRRYVYLILIIALGAIIYSNSLHGELCADDFMFVEGSPSIKDISNLKRVWQAHTTRFVFGLSIAFNYWLGKFETFGYHIFNVLIHVGNGILVYLFVFCTLQTPAAKKNIPEDNHEQIALFAALLFLAHPLQTEAVAYISQRCSSLGAFFYLATLFCYVKARLEGKKTYLIISFIAMLLGMFTKEFTITLPLMLTVYEFFFFGPWGSDGKKRIVRLVPFLAATAIIPITLSFKYPISILALEGQVSRNPFSWKYFLTEINVLRTYVRLLFLPIRQTHDYHYPITQGVDLPTLFSFCLLLGIFSYAIYFFKRSKILSFFITWCFITISIETGQVCFVQEGTIYEHWLYLPVVGFSVLVSCFGHRVIKERKYAALTLSIVVLIFSVMTYQRNKVWQTEIALWQDAVRRAPRRAWSHMALGIAYHRKDLLDQAIEFYEQALALDPTERITYFNLGSAYRSKGDYDKAKYYYERVLALSPEDHRAYAGLGSVSYYQKDLEKALGYALLAVSKAPYFASHWYQLGSVYRTRKEYEKSINSFKMAVDIDIDYKEAHNQLGELYNMLGQHEMAMAHFKKVEMLAKDEGDVYSNLALCYLGLNQPEEGIRHYQKARDLYIKKGQWGKVEEVNRLLNFLAQAGPGNPGKKIIIEK